MRKLTRGPLQERLTLALEVLPQRTFGRLRHDRELLTRLEVGQLQQRAGVGVDPHLLVRRHLSGGGGGGHHLVLQGEDLDLLANRLAWRLGDGGTTGAINTPLFGIVNTKQGHRIVQLGATFQF